MASPGLTKFRAQGPLLFLKTHAVVPCDHGLIERLTTNEGGDHLRMKIERRIAMFDIVKEQTKLHPEEGAYKVITKSCVDVPPGPGRADYDACYYLPWRAEGGIVETTLTPAPAVTRGRSNAVHAPPVFGIGAHRAPVTRGAATINPAAGLDPNLFFTTQLSGCSVFIKGTATDPMVYHAGKGSTVAPDPTKYWHDLFINSAAKSGGLPATFTEVTKNQYNYRQISNAGTVHESAKLNRNFTLYAQILIEDERRLNRPLFIHMVSGWGNVFGIRSATTRAWAFYRQEIVHIVYTRTPKVPITHPSVKGISRVAALTRVFPDEVRIVTPRTHCKPLKG